VIARRYPVTRRDGRVVDGGGLENRRTRKGPGGSNPSPSATHLHLPGLQASCGGMASPPADDSTREFCHTLGLLNPLSALVRRLTLRCARSLVPHDIRIPGPGPPRCVVDHGFQSCQALRVLKKRFLGAHVQEIPDADESPQPAQVRLEEVQVRQSPVRIQGRIADGCEGLLRPGDPHRTDVRDRLGGRLPVPVAALPEALHDHPPARGDRGCTSAPPGRSRRPRRAPR
jgi:hypothetical protein